MARPMLLLLVTQSLHRLRPFTMMVDTCGKAIDSAQHCALSLTEALLYPSAVP